mmetsp:Transcript_25518/g.46939  ORF Transcript_25518/g.46939 Transcript_25518/m.46939 type:complete len:243 (-) Transcript_25518:31-759(-)
MNPDLDKMKNCFTRSFLGEGMLCIWFSKGINVQLVVFWQALLPRVFWSNVTIDSDWTDEWIDDRVDGRYVGWSLNRLIFVVCDNIFRTHAQVLLMVLNQSWVLSAIAGLLFKSLLIIFAKSNGPGGGSCALHCCSCFTNCLYRGGEDESSSLEYLQVWSTSRQGFDRSLLVGFVARRESRPLAKSWGRTNDNSLQHQRSLTRPHSIQHPTCLQNNSHSEPDSRLSITAQRFSYIVQYTPRPN